MTTKLKTLKQRLNNVVNICGRKFRIVWGKGNIGGQFHTLHPKTGGGLILLGDGPADEYYQLNNILHEFMEVVMTLQGIRYYENDEKMLFVMTHEEFSEMVFQFARAMIDSGLIQVRETGDEDDTHK